jgi:GAF domain-containing protein
VDRVPESPLGKGPQTVHAGPGAPCIPRSEAEPAPGLIDIVINGTYWAGAAAGALLTVPATSDLPVAVGWRVCFGLGVVLGVVVLLVRRNVPGRRLRLRQQASQGGVGSMIVVPAGELRDEGAERAPGERYADLIDSLTELAGALTRSESVRETLGSILALALRTIPGCHAASVTVLDGSGRPGTIIATDDATYELDRRQYELLDGPCLDAARRQVVNRWSLDEAEQRFPDFTRLAQEMGLRSYLSAGLTLAGRRLGALNLSSHDADGFSQLDEEMLSLITVPAAAAIVVADRYASARDLAAQLEQALKSRAVIDRAVGIIMAQSRCAADEAFATLSRASNNRNIKVRDLAADIVQRVADGGPG